MRDWQVYWQFSLLNRMTRCGFCMPTTPLYLTHGTHSCPTTKRGELGVFTWSSPSSPLRGFQTNFSTLTGRPRTWVQSWKSYLCKLSLTLYCLARQVCDAVPKFRFQFKKGSSKNFPWALRLWAGRRKEPILGYVPKNYEKIIHVLKG